MRLIDADKIHFYFDTGDDAPMEGRGITYQADINRVPTVDAVEVVRCKDCKYLMFSDCYGECSRGHMGIVSPDDYCSRGERKDGGE